MKVLFSLFALLLLLAPLAHAAIIDGDFIGIFADAEGTVCYMNSPTPYTTKTIYILASFSGDFNISAAEFRVGNFSALSGFALPTVVWTTTLVIGDAATGVALAWTEVIAGPLANFGRIDLFILSDPPADTMIRILPTDTSHKRVIVDDVLFEEFPVDGNVFVFNPGSGESPCDIDAPAERANWGAIKALY